MRCSGSNCLCLLLPLAATVVIGCGGPQVGDACHSEGQMLCGSDGVSSNVALLCSKGRWVSFGRCDGGWLCETLTEQNADVLGVSCVPPGSSPSSDDSQCPYGSPVGSPDNGATYFAAAGAPCLLSDQVACGFDGSELECLDGGYVAVATCSPKACVFQGLGKTAGPVCAQLVCSQ